MKLPRGKFLHLAAGAAALPTISRSGSTQAYPGRPVSLLTGFAAAGGSDVVARLIGQWSHQSGPRTVSRQWACADRPARGASGADVSDLCLIGRICKVRQAVRFGGNISEPLGDAAGPSDCRRVLSRIAAGIALFLEICYEPTPRHVRQ
jgi:hypothetical protein